MTSPQLVAQAARTVSEEQVRALAIAKAKAYNAYQDVLTRSPAGLSEAALTDLEIERARAFSAYWEANLAFTRAI